MAADDVERTLLMHSLNRQRHAVVDKVAGLSEADVRRVLVPSGWHLIGLVSHLAYVERFWFREVLLGETVDFPWTDDNPDADWQVEEERRASQVIAFYRQECTAADEAIASYALDAPPRGKARPNADSLRWIMLHMIEETARHAGHADIARELIDGRVGDT